MTFEAGFPQRLTKIDELMRRDHVYLSDDDDCYFIGEYAARVGYACSATNNLILNFKKGMDRRGSPEWQYKDRAIKEAATAFRIALVHMGQQALNGMTFVPVPPSKAKDDDLYDDRLTQMLNLIRPEPKLDVREVILQEHSTDPSHSSDVRLGPDEIQAMYGIAEELTQPEPDMIVVVDDVLTTGAHYRAVKSGLAACFPGRKIIGLFIARRVPDTSDFDDVVVIN